MKEEFEKQETNNDEWLAGLDEEKRALLIGSDIEQPFESKVRHLLDEETEREDEDLLQRVMADMEEFKQLEDRTKDNANI